MRSTELPLHHDHNRRCPRDFRHNRHRPRDFRHNRSGDFRHNRNRHQARDLRCDRTTTTRSVATQVVGDAFVPGDQGGVDVAGADTPTPAGGPGAVGPGGVGPGTVDTGGVDTGGLDPGGLDPNGTGTFSPVVACREALAALIHASGALPQFDPEIPWTGPVFARARELAEAHWGGGSRR